MESDAAYFSRRAREERAAARSATHPNVRHAHRTMADAYEHRLSDMASDERRAGIHLVSAA